MAQNEANGVGDANSAPSATYPPVYHTLLPMAHGFNNDHTIFQSPQQPGFDAEDADAEEVLPQLEEEVVAEVESLTNNNSVFDSTITQNSPLSDADNEDILQELEEVVAAAAIHSVADDQSTDNSTTTQNPQITDTDAANIPPGLQEAVTASTADSLGYPSMSIEQLQGTALALTAHINAIVTAHSDPTDDQPAIPAPMLTLAEALDPMFFAMWNPAGAQHVHRYTGRISLTPSREEVVAFIEGLEKVDAESLESDSKECGICRGKRALQYHSYWVAANKFASLRTLRGTREHERMYA